MFFYKLKIFLLRIMGYDKPLRVAVLRYLTLKFKTFRPHYETILLEGVLEARKLGYKTVSVLELGVAGGNGIVALEKYKKKIEKITNIEINIYGFDSGGGLPETNNKYDLPFFWKTGDFKVDKEKLEKIIDSKIFYGDIKYTVDDFIKIHPKNIIAIFCDLDFYTSTKSFLNQMSKLKQYLCPRVYFYFDDIFDSSHCIDDQNGELLAIQEFNNENINMKIGKSLSNSLDFRFPIGKDYLFLLHNFKHKDYNNYIGSLSGEDYLGVGNKKIRTKIFDI